MARHDQVEYYDCEGWISARIEPLPTGEYRLVIWDIYEKILHDKTYMKHKSARISLGQFSAGSAYQIRGPIDPKERRQLFERWLARA